MVQAELEESQTRSVRQCAKSGRTYFLSPALATCDKEFDIVTTTGHWPQCAVLARAVAGVTERPFQLGDPIYEFVLLGRFAVSSRSAINFPALPYSSFLSRAV
jgi:hypothetical protein